MNRRYLFQVAVALDQVANTLLGGWADETLSSRAWRQHTKKKRWAVARLAIDTIFFWQHNHCQDAYESELRRMQSPPAQRPS